MVISFCWPVFHSFSLVTELLLDSGLAAEIVFPACFCVSGLSGPGSSSDCGVFVFWRQAVRVSSLAERDYYKIKDDIK